MTSIRQMEVALFDHIGLKVKDVAGSVDFYTAARAPLGCELASRDDSGAGFGPPGEPALLLNRAAVDHFHAAGLAAGGRDNGPPGLRLDYSPSYYAAFLIDPDGNNVEAVC